MSNAGAGNTERGSGPPLGRNALCSWHSCRGCKYPRRFVAHDEAVRWLQAQVGDSWTFIDLRRVLADHGDDHALCRENEQRAIDRMAALLVSGRLLVCGEQGAESVRVPEKRLKSSKSALEPLTAAPIRAVIPQSPRPTVPLPEIEPPPIELDVAAMVETLRTAARDGVPFCEECEKARQQAVAA
jgi:hypothetical protein